MGFSITAPEARIDTASAVTRGEIRGNEYLINGTQVTITKGTVAKCLLVYCLANPEAASKSKRHSIVLVETDRERYKADRIWKMGIRASDTTNVYFNNVHV